VHRNMHACVEHSDAPSARTRYNLILRYKLENKADIRQSTAIARSLRGVTRCGRPAAGLLWTAAASSWHRLAVRSGVEGQLMRV
jgi:hypothetical protein